MNFSQSTQKSKWLFKPQDLERTRATLLTSALQLAQQGPTQPDEALTLTADDERKLLTFYHRQTMDICNSFKFPHKVIATALIYLKRFYLAYSTVEYNPRDLMVTCIYLACKIEEHYIGAEELCRHAKVNPEMVLRRELTLLQGVKFDLICYAPYRAVTGFLEDIEECRKQGTADLDDSLKHCSQENMHMLKHKVLGGVEALMCSDAPLMFPPGLLALAALRSGCKRMNLECKGYLGRVAKMAMQVADDEGLASADEGQPPLQRLLRHLDELDKLGSEGAKQVTSEVAATIDRKITMIRQLNTADKEGRPRKKPKTGEKCRSATPSSSALASQPSGDLQAV